MTPHPRAVTPVVAAILALLVPGPAAAAKLTLSTGDFLVSCTSTGQVCEPAETLAVDVTSKKLKIKKITYETPAGHCSSGRILISVDGRQVARTKFLGRLETTSVKPKKLKLPQGEHTLGFQFEGRPGGCNTGFVSSWGGIVVISARGTVGSAATR